MTERDAAYLAGFFDGEGCIGYYNANPDPEGTPYYHVSVNIVNTDPRPINWIRELLGFGRAKAVNFADNKRRTAYQWQISKRSEVKTFLDIVRSHLIVKAEQADILLALFELEKGYIKKPGSVSAEVLKHRQEAAVRIKALKRESMEGVETRRAESLIH